MNSFETNYSAAGDTLNINVLGFRDEFLFCVISTDMYQTIRPLIFSGGKKLKVDVCQYPDSNTD